MCFGASCLTKLSSLKMQPIERMESAILERIFIGQHFSGIWLIPQVEHTGFEVPSLKFMGTRAFKGIVTGLF